MVPLSVRIPITVERVEMSTFIKKIVGTSSNTSSSRIDEQLRQIQENTQKYENKLFDRRLGIVYQKLGNAKTKHQRNIPNRNF